MLRRSLFPVKMLGFAALVALPIAGLVAITGVGRAAEPAVTVPAPLANEAAKGEGLETIVLAGGCFWGVQAVFQHVEGVESAVSGYAGGEIADPTYKQVSSGGTGHAEAVKVTFDPAKVSYGTLLQVFFSVAHNPTQLNFQGPDYGTQYRSAIFVSNEEQKKVAEAYVAQLDAAKVFSGPIVTEIAGGATFFAAEDYHQDYAYLHPNQPYIAWNDLPKVDNLKAMFPELWRAEPKLVFPAGAS